MKRKIISFITFIIALILVAGYAYAQEGPTPRLYIRGEEPAQSNGSYVISVYDGSKWNTAGAIQYNQFYMEKRLDISKFIPSSGTVKLKVAQNGGGAAQIDSIFFGGNAPISVNNSLDYTRGQPLQKLSAEDLDVVSVDSSGITIDFLDVSSSKIISMTARIEGMEITKEPFNFPKANDFMTVTPQSQFYTYKLGTNHGSLIMDGEPAEVSGRTTFFKEYCQPSTGHPDGYMYGWVMDDGGSLYVTLDFTSDNTMDGDKDYCKVYAKTSSGVKEYKVTVSQTQYGCAGFTYTDKVAYQHKVYEFKIPAGELDADANGNVFLAFAGYGTSAQSIVPNKIYYDPVNPSDIDNIVLSTSNDHKFLGIMNGTSILNYPKDYTYYFTEGDGVITYYITLKSSYLKNIQPNKLKIKCVDYNANDPSMTISLYNFNSAATPAVIMDTSVFDKGTFPQSDILVKINPAGETLSGVAMGYYIEDPINSGTDYTITATDQNGIISLTLNKSWLSSNDTGTYILKYIFSSGKKLEYGLTITNNYLISAQNSTMNKSLNISYDRTSGNNILVDLSQKENSFSQKKITFAGNNFPYSTVDKLSILPSEIRKYTPGSSYILNAEYLKMLPASSSLIFGKNNGKDPSLNIASSGTRLGISISGAGLKRDQETGKNTIATGQSVTLTVINGPLNHTPWAEIIGQIKDNTGTNENWISGISGSDLTFSSSDANTAVLTNNCSITTAVIEKDFVIYLYDNDNYTFSSIGVNANPLPFTAALSSLQYYAASSSTAVKLTFSEDIDDSDSSVENVMNYTISGGTYIHPIGALMTNKRNEIMLYFPCEMIGTIHIAISGIHDYVGDSITGSMDYLSYLSGNITARDSQTAFTDVTTHTQITVKLKKMVGSVIDYNNDTLISSCAARADGSFNIDTSNVTPGSGYYLWAQGSYYNNQLDTYEMGYECSETPFSITNLTPITGQDLSISVYPD